MSYDGAKSLPFQSGNDICYKSQDYAKYFQPHDPKASTNASVKSGGAKKKTPAKKKPAKKAPAKKTTTKKSPDKKTPAKKAPAKKKSSKKGGANCTLNQDKNFGVTHQTANGGGKNKNQDKDLTGLIMPSGISSALSTLGLVALSKSDTSKAVKKAKKTVTSTVKKVTGTKKSATKKRVKKGGYDYEKVEQGIERAEGPDALTSPYMTGEAAKTVQQNGGQGSSWLMTHNSRGPVGTPDNGWYNGKAIFGQFADPKLYIPNSALNDGSAYSQSELLHPELNKGPKPNDPNNAGAVLNKQETNTKVGGAKKSTRGRKPGSAKKSATKKPATKKPATKKPATKKTVAKKSSAKKPATKKTKGKK